MILHSIAVLAILAQAPAPQSPALPTPPPATPDGCVKLVRDFTIAQQRALKQVTAETVRKIEADKQVLAKECAAQFNVDTVAVADLAGLVALYGESNQPALAKAALDRALTLKTLPVKTRAEVLAQAVSSGLREPKSPERNARLEAYVDELDRLKGDDLFDIKLSTHSRMNGYYRGDDIDDGIIKHSTWLIKAGETFTPVQRTQYGFSIVSAYVNMAEALAGQGQNDKALALLGTAKKEFGDLRNADRMIDPIVARYSLVGKVGAPIVAPHWLNAAPNTKIPMTGAVTLLEFTAHWCGPCKESYPGVNRLLAKYGSQGFRVVLATELYGYFGTERPLTAEQEIERDREYWAHEVPKVPVAIENQMTAPVRNADGTVTIVENANDKAYEVGGIPQIHIIDKQGRIRLIMVGYDDANEKSLAALIEKLLKEK
jgi:thiol-disulfide isomerase/thioredoxin